MRSRTIRSATCSGVSPVAAARASTAAGDVADALDRGQHRGRAVVDRLLVEVDHPAGIGQIVRHVGDAARGQHRVVLRLGQLVVGPAADQPHAQMRDGPVVQHGTQRAGREHVDRLLVDRLRPDHLGLQLARGLGGPRRIDVADDQRGAARAQMLAQRDSRHCPAPARRSAGPRNRAADSSAGRRPRSPSARRRRSPPAAPAPPAWRRRCGG